MNNTHESYWREFWSWSSWGPRTLTWNGPGALATNKYQSRDLMGSLSLLFCDGTKWSGEAPWTPPPGLLSRLGLGLAIWIPGKHEHRRWKRKELQAFHTCCQDLGSSRGYKQDADVDACGLERRQLACDFPRIWAPAWSQLQKAG